MTSPKIPGRFRTIAGPLPAPGALDAQAPHPFGSLTPAHEARGQVALVEAPRLRPLGRKSAGRGIHLALALQQLAIGLVEDRDDEP
ncbi:MAG: hypothetical protein ABIQ29_04210, partial [Burkholderiaceae bacterium]